jgi:acylphosphatase
MKPAEAARWIVSGRVQGVGFRWFTVRRAQALELSGWVSNLPDGRVEVVAAGPSPQMKELEAAISRGPAGANVESVEKSNIPHETVGGKSFEIR